MKSINLYVSLKLQQLMIVERFFHILCIACLGAR